MCELLHIYRVLEIFGRWTTYILYTIIFIGFIDNIFFFGSVYKYYSRYLWNTYLKCGWWEKRCASKFSVLTLYGASNKASMSKSSAIFLCLLLIFVCFYDWRYKIIRVLTVANVWVSVSPPSPVYKKVAKKAILHTIRLIRFDEFAVLFFHYVNALKITIFHLSKVFAIE